MWAEPTQLPEFSGRLGKLSHLAAGRMTTHCPSLGVIVLQFFSFSPSKFQLLILRTGLERYHAIDPLDIVISLYRHVSVSVGVFFDVYSAMPPLDRKPRV